MSAIRCRGLTAWHKGEQVLKGVDLLVEPGEVCLLLGAPDSGRTDPGPEATGLGKR